MIRDKHSSGEDRHMTEMTTTPFTQNATELSEIPTSDPESPDLDPDYELPYRCVLLSEHLIYVIISIHLIQVSYFINATPTGKLLYQNTRVRLMLLSYCINISYSGELFHQYMSSK